MNEKASIYLMLRLVLFASLLVLSERPLLSNDNINRTLSREQATEDLSIYFELIDKQHGNPYQFISRSAFLNALNTTIDNLPEQIEFKAFEVTLSKLNNLIRCGHTIINLDANLIKSASEANHFFPLPIALIKEQVYVDFEDSAIPHGAQLIAINGQEVGEVINELLPLTVTDGFSQAKPLRELETKFGYYFFLKYGAYNSFEVTYLTPKGTQTKTTISGVAGNQMLANNYYRPVYKTNERYYHFTHLDAIDSLQTLVLTLNTFQANPDWFAERLSALYDQESKKFEFDNLVIDLRNNEGGDRRLLTLLYQFVAGEHLVDPSNTSIRSNQIQFEDYLLGINGAVGSKEAIEKAKTYLNQHFTYANEQGFESAEQNWYDTFDAGINWQGQTFNGQVYVLTSGKTFSAAADLARILAELDNVILVGEETGGAHIGRTANMLLNYDLPNTHTMVQIPVIYEEFVNANKQNEGRGTFPDFHITQTYPDLLAKKDSAFEFTLDLIQQKQLQGAN